jgi:3-dehydroquinate synthase
MIKDYSFGSRVVIEKNIPALDYILGETGKSLNTQRALFVCDSNTLPIAKKIAGNRDVPFCTLAPGEEAKQWPSIEAILLSAKNAGCGRDSLFIAVGGGVISDLTAFAASVYMRGCGLCVVSTTLLGMADASMGGKTGFDLFNIKNLAGTFYPAPLVYMPMEALETLPAKEWKSGFAEIIKTAIIDNEDFFNIVSSLDRRFPLPLSPSLMDCISRSVTVKGRIVEADPFETGTPSPSGEKRAFLNLGHTFGHALESAAGLGRISHGEAVAWGIARACELGLALGVSSPGRVTEIKNLLSSFGYEISAPCPFPFNSDIFFASLKGDKKNKNGKPVFIVPCGKNGVTSVSEQVNDITLDETLIKHIISGEKYS